MHYICSLAWQLLHLPDLCWNGYRNNNVEMCSVKEEVCSIR